MRADPHSDLWENTKIETNVNVKPNIWGRLFSSARPHARLCLRFCECVYIFI